MLLDNKNNSHVGNTLREHLAAGSILSVLSSQFTIYGFAALKKELSRVESVRLLFANSDSLSLQSLIGSQSDLRLINQPDQKRLAKECGKWLASKVEVKAGKARQNLFLIQKGSQGNLAIHGSSGLSPSGLGEVTADTPQAYAGRQVSILFG